MPGIERPSGDATPSRRRSGQSDRRATDEDEELYQIVYEESHRTLDNQKDELNSIRDRTVQYAIFIGAATAFLVGSGLAAPHRDVSFYALAIIASLFSLMVIGLLFSILNPSTKHLWVEGVSADYLIENWVKKADPRPRKAEFVRDLAIMNADSQQNNQKLLAPLRTRYRYLIAAGALQVIVWAALVWWKG